MKSPIQTAVLIGALVGVIFLVTFVSEWTSSGETKKPIIDKPGSEKRRALEFPVTRAPEKEEDPPIVSEMHPTTGHRDFWFQNKHDVPIELGLEAKSCKCEKVMGRLLSKEEEQKYQANRAIPEAGWQLLGNSSSAEPPLKIPPGASGFVRLVWDGKAEKKQVLKVQVWTAAAGDDLRSLVTLEVSVDFVQPFYIAPYTLKLPAALHDGQKTRVSFLAWSRTRSKVNLTASPVRETGCLQCEVSPATAEYLDRTLPREEPRPILGGCQVTVTVHTQRDGQTLDLGPFNRSIRVVCDGNEDLAREVFINGVVVGNIRLLTEDQKEWINLEDFRARDGKTMTVGVETEAGLENLEVEKFSPSYLKVQLEPDPESPRGKKQWKLKVGVPAGRADGKLPRDSGITLKTSERPPRRLKIPVLGHATND